MLYRFGTTCCLYQQRSMSENKKDVLPTFQQCNVIYQFSCTVTVGMQVVLQDRIKQHIPKSTRNAACS